MRREEGEVGAGFAAAGGRGDVDEMLEQRAAWADRPAKDFGSDGKIFTA